MRVLSRGLLVQAAAGLSRREVVLAMAEARYECVQKLQLPEHNYWYLSALYELGTQQMKVIDESSTGCKGFIGSCC